MNSSDYENLVEMHEALEGLTDKASRRLFDLYEKYDYKAYGGSYQDTRNVFPQNGGYVEEFDNYGVGIYYYVGDQREYVTIPIRYITDDTADEAFAELEADLQTAQDAKRAAAAAQKEHKAKESERKAAEKEAKERALLEELKAKYGD